MAKSKFLDYTGLSLVITEIKKLISAHTSNNDIHVTTTDKNNLTSAYNHSQSDHAPINAEVNQNAFSKVVIGDVEIEADAKTDSLNLVAGDNITLTPDADNDSITIASSGGSSYTHPTHDSKTSGLYKISVDELGHVDSATAVTKNDIVGLGIPESDTVYTHPITSGNKHIPSGGSSGQILTWSSDGTAVWGEDHDKTYSTGTASTAGLTKLYTASGTATDGTMTQKAISDMFTDVTQEQIDTIFA